METKTIKVGEKEFTVHEILARAFDANQEIESLKDRIEDLIKSCADMTEEVYATLTVRERSKVLNAINQVNGWIAVEEKAKDFQEPDSDENKKE